MELKMNMKNEKQNANELDLFAEELSDDMLGRVAGGAACISTVGTHATQQCIGSVGTIGSVATSECLAMGLRD